MSMVLWFPVAALNSALRACERRPWRQWWMRGERKTRERSSTAPRPLWLCRHSCTPRGSLKTSWLQQEFTPSQPQWRSRCMGKKDTSLEAPVFRNSLLQFPVLCAHAEQTIPHSAVRWSSSCPSLMLWTPAPQRPEVSGLVTSLPSSGGGVDVQCYFSKWHFVHFSVVMWITLRKMEVNTYTVKRHFFGKLPHLFPNLP